MPILSIYLGQSEISVLFASSSVQPTLFNFPYSIKYENAFNEFLIQSLKNFQVKPEECAVHVVGYPQFPPQTLNSRSSVEMGQLISSVSPYFAYHVSNYTLITPLGARSAMDISRVKYEDLSTYLNVALYPQLIPTDEFDRMDMDSMIRFDTSDIEPQGALNNQRGGKREAAEQGIGKPVVFTGDRFSFQYKKDVLTYVLMFDLIKNPGVFEVKLDTTNILAPAALLASVDPKYTNILHDISFESIGTLVNVTGGAECLIKSEDGTSALVEVEPDKIFTVPMLSSAKSTLFIKHSSVGSMEYQVSGGSMGVIFDSRPKNDPKIFNRKYYEQSFKNWNNLISEVLCTSL